MAKPIKETPILEGRQAATFLTAIKKNETDKSKRVSKEAYEKSKKAFDRILSNAKL